MRMTRRRKLAVLGIAGAGAVIWLAWPSRLPTFDCAVRWTEPPASAEVTEYAAELLLLPTGFHQVVKALRGWGFSEGDFVVGRSYRRRPIPEPNSVNESERVVFEHFNRMLDDNAAQSVKPFYLSIPGRGFCGLSACAYLFLKEDGDTVLRAFVNCPKPRP